MSLIAPAWWLSWLEHHPIHQKVVSSTPGEGRYLGCGFDPQEEYIWETTDQPFSLTSMFLSPTPLSPFLSL